MKFDSQALALFAVILVGAFIVGATLGKGLPELIYVVGALAVMLAYKLRRQTLIGPKRKS